MKRNPGNFVAERSKPASSLGPGGCWVGKVLFAFILEKKAVCETEF